MELAVVCGIVLAFYFVFRLGSRMIALFSGGRFRAYRILADRYHGQYESRGMYDPPTVSFNHRGSLVRVGLAPLIPGQPPNPRIRVVSRFKTAIPFRLELAPFARAGPRQEPRGTKLVALGLPHVDREFSIRTNDPEMAREFLNPRVHAAILDLQEMVHPGGILVSINPERQLIQVDRNLGIQVELLERVVADALVLQDGLTQSVTRRMSAGINIMAVPVGPAREASDPPICKVCGEPIGDGPVLVCTTCQTPHHRDCWEYVGSCSIYGCGGKAACSE